MSKMDGKKSVRKSFAKVKQIMDVPYLIAIPKESYENFLQRNVPLESRKDVGIHRASCQG